MTSTNPETFRLPARSPLAWLVAVPFLVLAVLSWPHKVLVAAVVVEFAAIYAVMLFASVVTVGNEGLRLYRVWKLPWSSVKGARRISFLGLPYALVARHKGFTWWLPLYFRGSRPIESALAERAPEGSPLRGIADG